MHIYSSNDSRAAAYGAMATIAVMVAIIADTATTAVEFIPGWIVSAPTIAASFGLLYRGVDVAAWKWGWLQASGLIATPIVSGTYEGVLVSNYGGGTTVPIKLQIEQRWTRIIVRLEVVGRETSTSRSVAAALASLGKVGAQLTYTYKNEVSPGVADSDMSDHDGTADLFFDGCGNVSGRYFNARGRQGTMTLTRLT